MSESIISTLIPEVKTSSASSAFDYEFFSATFAESSVPRSWRLNTNYLLMHKVRPAWVQIRRESEKVTPADFNHKGNFCPGLAFPEGPEGAPGSGVGARRPRAKAPPEGPPKRGRAQGSVTLPARSQRWNTIARGETPADGEKANVADDATQTLGADGSLIVTV